MPGNDLGMLGFVGKVVVRSANKTKTPVLGANSDYPRRFPTLAQLHAKVALSNWGLRRKAGQAPVLPLGRPLWQYSLP